MIKKLIISISCGMMLGVISMSTALADSKKCQNQTGSYCIYIDMKDKQKQKNVNSDLCYVLQINASDQLVSGSLPVSQLPEAVFTLTKNEALSGKPLVFKIIKVIKYITVKMLLSHQAAIITGERYVQVY